MNSLYKLIEIKDTSVLQLFLTALGIYISVIILTRIFGKRSFSKMSSFDFAMTVAIGSIIASTLLSSTVSMLEGIIGLVIVYVLQITAALVRRIEWMQELMDNSPLLLMDGERILEDNLRKARVTQSDLRSKLREANVTRLSQIKAVIFETTGDISVLHKDADHSVEDWLMKDVLT
ncbi:MAG: YetF domain-containing protein [Pricia sp.]